MKKNNVFLIFFQVYGWAILSAVVVIGVLWYFGVFSPCKYGNNTCGIDANCLSQKFCENQNLNLSSVYGDDIYCRKYMMQSIYWKIEFVVENWTELQNKFPECKK